MNFHEKLRVKFKVSAEDALAVRLKLEAMAEVVTPDFILDLVNDDPDDNRVLECAVAGRVDYIISGDRHLLKLEAHAGIPILTAREFLQR